ncbi:MAG: hypothetical protein ACRC3J_05475 [Culicoidibacterales bacterium]
MKQNFLKQINKIIADENKGEHCPRGFEDGLWKFYNIRDLFMFSQSVRYDYVRALVRHYDIHKTAWSTTEPASTGLRPKEYDTFIKLVQSYVVDQPYRVLMNSSNGEMWECLPDIVHIFNAFDMGGQDKTNFRILEQPSDKVIFVEENAFYSVIAENYVSYEWESNRENCSAGQVDGWTPMGIFDKNLLITRCLMGEDNRKFRARFTLLNGKTAYSRAAQVNVCTHINVEKQPTSEIVVVGDKVAFEFGYTGIAQSIWQALKPGATEWEEVMRGATRYIIEETTPEHNNMRFRGVIVNLLEQKYTDIVTLTVYAPIVITKDLVDITVEEGGRAKFEIEYTGGVTDITWERKAAGSDDWVAFRWGTTEYTIDEVQPWEAGDCYRCILKNEAESAWSNEVFLDVNGEFRIIRQPRTKRASYGMPHEFDIQYGGGRYVTCQWQWQSAEGTPWYDLADDAKSRIYVNPRCTDGTAARYRCVLKKGEVTIESDVVAPTFGLNITKPVPSQVYVSSGDVLKLGLEHDGNPEFVTYNWTVMGAGIVSTEPEFVLDNVTGDFNGKTIMYYIRDKRTSPPSKSTTVNVNNPVKFTKQPVDVTAEIGEVAQFEYDYTGGDAIVKRTAWQTIASDGRWIDLDGQTEKTLIFDSVSLEDCGKYRAAVYVSDSGKFVHTKEVTLSAATFAFIFEPADTTAFATEQIKLSCDFTGGGFAPSIHWEIQKSGESTWEPLYGDASKSYIKDNVPADWNNASIRVRIYNGTDTIISREAKLTINEHIRIITQPVGARRQTGDDYEMSVVYELFDKTDFAFSYWEVKRPGEDEWIPLDYYDEYHLSKVMIRALDEQDHCAWFRARIRCKTATVYTNEVQMLVDEIRCKPAVARDPKSTLIVGPRMHKSTASMKFADFYVWEAKEPNTENWYVVDYSYNKKEMNFDMMPSRDGLKIRITGANDKGRTYSKEATLSCIPNPEHSEL